METQKEKVYREALEKILAYTPKNLGVYFIKPYDFKKHAIKVAKEALAHITDGDNRRRRNATIETTTLYFVRLISGLGVYHGR